MPSTTLSTYDGAVVVGGPPAVRELNGVRMTKIAVGPYDNNAYLLECTATGDRLLIDAAAEPERLRGLVGNGGLGQVLTTHQHYDHWGALAEIVASTGAKTLMHPADSVGLGIPVDVPVRDGDEIRVGNARLRAIHLVGHTLGSIALAYTEPDGRQHIWTGDALFPGGIGKTYDDPALFGLLFAGVSTKIFDVFDDNTSIYPGHGADTTLGAQRPHLSEWKERGW